MDFLNKIDRQKLQKITLMVIAALTLLAMVLLLVIIISSAKGSSPAINKDNTIVDTRDIQFKKETITANQLLKGSLLLVNGEHDYSIPSDVTLVNIYEYRNSHSEGIPYSIGDIYNLKLEASAMENAHNMLVSLTSETNNDNIYISSSYGKNDTSKDIHTGLTMVLSVAGAVVADPFEDENYAVLKDWLIENAHKYGFVVRYPADKADITGEADYKYAFRYVGLPHAKYMYDNNLCLEEYIAYLKGNTSDEQMLSVTATDNISYGIYYVPCSDDSNEIKVPETVPNPDGSTKYSYTISGTNEGGVIVTVTLN